jgi:leucyl aminopeptidase
MKTKISKKLKSKKGLLVVPVFSGELKRLPAEIPNAIKEFVKERVKSKEFRAKKMEKVFTYTKNKGIPSKLILIGCGEVEKFDVEAARNLGGKIGKMAKCKKETEVSIILNGKVSAMVGDLVEGYISSQYSKALFKTDKKKTSLNTKTLNLITNRADKKLKEEVKEAELISGCANFVKTLVNSPANIVGPSRMVTEARRIAKQNGYKQIVLGDRQLKKLGCGGILAVNQGSDQEAKLIVLEYRGAKSRSEKPVVLVGKGVIFDTGGYNMKRTGSMETMQQDMAGGASVLGVFETLKKLKVQKNVIGIVPVVQNMVNHKAYRPSDIITMFSGNTVEVTNTDAEGRLILADALHYGSKLKPESMITIATLTGAVGVALGDRYCGIMGNDSSMLTSLKEAGEQVDELSWPLPIHQDYRNKMNSKVADFTNYDVGTGRSGGTVKAASFLEKFVGDNKWCHIDIGGTAFTTNPKEYQCSGATAHGFRLMLQFLRNKI